MTEERRIQLVAEVDTTRTRTGFNEIAQQGESMAAQVTRSGEQAQRSVSNIGTGAGRSAQSVEAAQRNIIGSIQRTAAAMQAGSRSGAEYYEVLARQRGVDPAVLAPYLAQLRAVETQQQRVGMSTREYSAAMRNVPAQITDIVTGLQGGMPIMTIAIQQGGQLRDMFGGIAPAARALSTQLLGMITPYTLFGAALAAVGIAYNQGSKEADAFRLSIITTGNAVGVTTSQLAGMAKQASDAAGTQGANAEALAALVGTGRVAASQLVASSVAAVSAQKYLGIAVDATVKSFADLGGDPLKATIKLNEQYGYLTLSTYKQIQALEDQGKQSDAAKVAQAAYADMLTERSKKVEGSLGSLEKGWNLLGSSAKAAWDRMLDIGRETSLEDKIQAARQRLVDAQKGIAAPPAISTTGMAPSLGLGTGQKETAAQAQKELDALLAQQDSEKRLAAIESERNRLTAAGIKWAEDGEQYLTRAQGLQKALNESRERGLVAGESDAEIAKRALAIRAQYADVVNAGVESQIAAITRIGAIQEEAAKRARLILEGDQQAAGTQALDKRVEYAEKAAKLDEEALQREKSRIQQQLNLTTREVVSDDQRSAQQQKLADMRGQISLVDEQILTRRTQLSKDLTAMDVADTNAAIESQERMLAARQADIDALRGQVQAQKDENATIGMTTKEAQAYNTELVEERARRLELDASIADTTLGREADAEKMRESARLMRELNAERNAGANKKELFEGDLTRATNLLTIMQAVDDGARQAAQGMAESFGSVGKAIGDLTTSLTGYQARQAAIAAQLAAVKVDPKSDRIKIAQAEQAASKASAQAQIKSYGDMAGAAKGFFNENSKGYKVLEATEKAYRATEMVMAIQSMAEKLFGITAVTTATVTGEAVKTAAVEAGTVAQVASDTVKGTSAAAVGVATQAQGDPYTAWARMAAMAAAMAALGFSVFGGGGSGGGKSAAEVQKAQGTGSVFGDIGMRQANGDVLYSAKSDSIRRSIEQLTTNSSDMLPINQGMLTALQNIESSMTGLTNLVVRTTGLTDGTNMGIQEGTVGKSTGASIAAGAQLGSMAGSYFGPIGMVIGAIGGAIIGGLKSIWGKTTQTIVDSGLQYGGSVRDLQAGQGFDQYASVDTTKSSFFGLSKSTSNRVEVQGLNDELSKQFGLIFTNLDKSLQAAATAMGGSATDVTKVLDNLTLESTKVSLKGLTGTALTDALNSVISKSMDEIAEAAFPQLDKFRTVGEGYAETVMRLAGDYAKLDSILAASSTTFGATGMASIAAREHLIELAGGIDQLASQTNSFTQNFLSKAEQLAPVQKYVTDQLAAMGLQSLDTRDKFKDYVLGLANSGQLATDAGAQQYAALLALADAFAKTHAATVDLTKSEQEITDERTDLQNKLDDLTMTQAQLAEKARAAISGYNLALYDQVQAAQKAADVAAANADYQKQIDDFLKSSMSAAEVRALETKGMAASTVALYDRLAGLKAEEAAAAVIKKAQESSAAAMAGFGNALADSMKRATEAAAAFRALNDALLIGDSSALNPEQKYLEAKRQFDTADGSNLAAAEKAFLDASKSWFGGSAGYAADFAAVIAKNSQFAAASDAQAAAIPGIWALIQKQMTGVDGSHKNGLDFVPFDGYRAELHRGERVQTAAAVRNGDAAAERTNALLEEVLTELRADKVQRGAVSEATIEKIDKLADSMDGQKRALRAASREKEAV